MKRTLLIAAIFINIFVQTHAEQNRPEFLKDVLGYLYFPKPAQTLSKINELFDLIGLSTFNAQGIISTLFLKNSKIESFDLSKEILYVRIHPKICPNPFLYVAHLKDKELFLTGFGKTIFGGKGFALNEATRGQPIQEFIEEKVQFDRAGYLKAQEQGSVDIVQFQKKVTIGYFVALIDTRVIVSGNRELVEKVLADPTTKLRTDENIDFELVLKPRLICETYQQDFQSLGQKFTPFFTSNMKTLPYILEITESFLGAISEIQFRSTLKNEVLELDMNIKSLESSPLKSFLSQPIPIQKLMSELPSDEFTGFLRLGLSISDDNLKILQSDQNKKTEVLIQNYLRNTEGILSVYILPIQNAIKTLMNIPIKEGRVKEAHINFKQLMHEGYKGQISEDPANQIQKIQFSKKQFYNTFLKNDHWMGFRFNSREDFRTSFLRVNSEKSQSGEFFKIVSGFPEKLNLFFYFRPEPQMFISGYGETRGKDLHLFSHLNVKEWMKTWGTKIYQKVKNRKQKTANPAIIQNRSK
jgi:hypothetical protein